MNNIRTFQSNFSSEDLTRWRCEIDKFNSDGHSYKSDTLARCYNAKLRDAKQVTEILDSIEVDLIGDLKYDLIRVNKYTEGQCLGMHCDALWFDGATHVAVLYLNDDFEGGELVICDDRMQHIDVIKPTPGKCVVMPLEYFHYTRPIQSGVKYCLAIQLCLDGQQHEK